MKMFSRLAIWLAALLAAWFLGTDAVWAQEANKTSLQGFVVTFSRFLEAIVLPLLFSIAFLYFIFNTAKYFIFNGDEDGAREEGKRNAIYGVAAFVFLISIWAIVSIFLNGLSLTRNRSLCADYFELFSGPCNENSGGTFTQPNINIGAGTTGTGTGGTGIRTGGTSTGGSANGGTGTGNGTGSGSGTGGTGGSTPGNDAPLAELIFGTGKDAASFNRSLATSSALASTPSIAATATCVDGFNTLKLSSGSEATQAAYLYFTNKSGQKRWRNITDQMSSNLIRYDRDVLDTIIQSGATNLHLVHTHPDGRVDGLGLAMTGHGPSAADLRAMCTLNNPAVTYVTVDEAGVWTTTHTAKTCPYTSNANNVLPTLETYIALATLEASSRSTELTDYLASALVPTAQKTHFGSLNKDNLASQTDTEILALSAPTQAFATTTITRYPTVDAFCVGR